MAIVLLNISGLVRSKPLSEGQEPLMHSTSGQPRFSTGLLEAVMDTGHTPCIISGTHVTEHTKEQWASILGEKYVFFCSRNGTDARDPAYKEPYINFLKAHGLMTPELQDACDAPQIGWLTLEGMIMGAYPGKILKPHDVVLKQ